MTRISLKNEKKIWVDFFSANRGWREMGRCRVDRWETVWELCYINLIKVKVRLAQCLVFHYLLFSATFLLWMGDLNEMQNYKTLFIIWHFNEGFKTCRSKTLSRSTISLLECHVSLVWYSECSFAECDGVVLYSLKI